MPIGFGFGKPKKRWKPLPRPGRAGRPTEVFGFFDDRPASWKESGKENGVPYDKSPETVREIPGKEAFYDQEGLNSGIGRRKVIGVTRRTG